MKALLVTLSLLILFAVPAHAQIKNDATVTINSELREAPSKSAKVQKEIEIGTEVKVLDFKDDWFVVRIDDAVGWMHRDAFSLPKETAPPVTVYSTSRPLRTEPTKPATVPESSSPGLNRGPRGGCYYINKSGKKVYVDRSRC
ncbi:MAG TPA: SH3 domain-containing protein [Pyrinomonadaceae bacterium]|nr:SH3 domain-containing protein [Pyrinomonadaceae bacterium]